MKIGVLLTGDYSWAGGVYYSLNIIKLLQKVSLDKNVKLVVFINKHTSQELIKEINIKNVEFVYLDRKPFFYKLWCKFMSFLTGTDYRFVSDINALKLDLLYPVIHYDKSHQRLNCKVYYWLFDFQHKFLPELFSNEELQKRDANFKQISEQARNIVVSSQDSKSHLLHFYPDCKASIHVYNFVSLLEKKYDSFSLKLPDNFFIVCNQFWPHKNHLVVLKAVKSLVVQNKSIHVVFTGKYDSTQNQTYVNQLKAFIEENKLQNYFTFTGFIEREEQVALIKKAKAVVQPSLFEGWSTVIEDAKALNKLVIASEISIHREQIKEHVLFFEPNDPEQLSELLLSVFDQVTVVAKNNYQLSIKDSSSKLQKLLGISNEQCT